MLLMGHDNCYDLKAQKLCHGALETPQPKAVLKTYRRLRPTSCMLCTASFEDSGTATGCNDVGRG